MCFLFYLGNYSCFTLYNTISFNDLFSNECDATIGQAYILIAGSSTGNLSKLNLFNGLVEFSTMAHDNEIVGIIHHMMNEQVNFNRYEKFDSILVTDLN